MNRDRQGSTVTAAETPTKAHDAVVGVNSSGALRPLRRCWMQWSGATRGGALRGCSVLALLLIALVGCGRADGGPAASKGGQPSPGGASASASGGTGAAARTAPAGPPLEVRTAPVERRNLSRVLEITGTLFGTEEATISAQVPARVESISKDFGDLVAPGEVLAQLDRTDYEMALELKRTAMLETLASLGLEALPGPEFDPATVPTVVKARLAAENAEARHRRAEMLWKQSPPLISEQDYTDLRTAWDIARSDAEVALLAAKATVAEARSRAADQAIAAQRLVDTTIRAPRLEGEGPVQYAVAARMASVGEYAPAGAALFRVIASDPIKFRGDVPERFAGQLRVGQDAALRVAAYDDSFAGVVARVNPQVDARSRTFEVEIAVPNADGRVKAGGFGRVGVVVGEDASVLLVPEDALVVFAGVIKLFSVKDGVAQEHRVELGRRIDGLVEVLSPPPGLERIVVSGAARLANGTPVREGSAEK